jgi:hypothetical protein
MDYSLLVVTLSLLRATSGSNQLGLVAKNVKNYIWLCRHFGQRSGPDTEWRRGTWWIKGFQQRGESVSVTQIFDFLYIIIKRTTRIDGYLHQAGVFS